MRRNKNALLTEYVMHVERSITQIMVFLQCTYEVKLASCIYKLKEIHFKMHGLYVLSLDENMVFASISSKSKSKKNL